MIIYKKFLSNLYVVTIFFIIVLLGACSTDVNEGVINLSHSSLKLDSLVRLSSLLKDYDFIPLETKPECLISQVSKVVRRDNYYYVLSGRDDLYVFNTIGEFVMKVGIQGRGPKEYLEIYDFDINSSESTIYFLDLRKIHVYDVENGSYLRSIPLEVIGNKIRIIDNNRIILHTTPEDDCLTLIDHHGAIIKTHLHSNQGNATIKPIPFLVDSNGDIIFQQGPTNDIIILNTKRWTFKSAILTKDDRTLGSIAFEEMIQEIGFEAYRKLIDFINISTVKFLDELTISIYYYQKESYMHIYDNRKKNGDTYLLTENNNLVDDICFLRPTYIRLCSLGESDKNSILTFISAYSFREGINNLNKIDNLKEPNLNHSKYISVYESVNDSSNPILIELRFANDSEGLN